MPARALPDLPVDFRSPADRVREFASILANGVRRLRDQAASSGAALSSENSSDFGTNGLELGPEVSVTGHTG